MTSEVLDAGVTEHRRLEWEKLTAIVARLFVLAGISYLVLFGLYLAEHDYEPIPPSRVTITENLYQGIDHLQEAIDSPNPQMIHALKIDVAKVKFFVSPGTVDGEMDSTATTTSKFLREYGLQAAINANFFKPFNGDMPIFIKPKLGEAVDAQGLVISENILYSEANTRYFAMCFNPENVEVRKFDCPAGTENAIAGNRLLVENGQVAEGLDNHKRHPRTAAAVSADGQTVWLVVVDGRQEGYSEGVTLGELAEILVELGADKAINLDGGGSATMATEEGKLNHTIQTSIPGLSRPASTHLGIYAEKPEG